MISQINVLIFNTWLEYIRYIAVDLSLQTRVWEKFIPPSDKRLPCLYFSADMRKQRLWPLWVTQYIVQRYRGSPNPTLLASIASQLLWDEHFVFLSPFTDAVLLQCRHLIVVEAKDLYVSTEQINNSNESFSTLSFAGAVPVCRLAAIDSIPLLLLVHGCHSATESLKRRCYYYNPYYLFFIYEREWKYLFCLHSPLKSH